MTSVIPVVASVSSGDAEVVADAVALAVAAKDGAEAAAIDAETAAGLAEDARDEAELFAFDATTALDLTKLSLYGEPDDKDAALILDFAPQQYLGKAHTMTGGERANAMIKTVLSSGPTLMAQGLSSFVTFTRSTTATRVNGAGLFETVPANVARIDYDPVTKECLGFLSERASTNLFTQSEFANGVTDAPVRTGLLAASSFEGLLNNTGIAFGYDGTTQSYAYKTVAGTSGLVTFSVFVRMDDGGAPAFGSDTPGNSANDFYLAIRSGVPIPTTHVVKDYGGGLYRVSVTADIGAGTGFGVIKAPTNSPRTFKVSGYQLEALPYATSYIPTTASQVTRTADSTTITGANFSRFFNADEGTIVIEYDYAGGGSNLNVNARNLAQIDSGSTPNRHLIYNGAGFTGAAYVISSNVGQTPALGGGGLNYPAGTPAKLAYAYAVNDFAVSVNGGAVVTDTAGALPIGLIRMLIGPALDGHIKSIRYFPTRLSNAQLQELSA